LEFPLTSLPQSIFGKSSGWFIAKIYLQLTSFHNFCSYCLCHFNGDFYGALLVPPMVWPHAATMAPSPLTEGTLQFSHSPQALLVASPVSSLTPSLTFSSALATLVSLLFLTLAHFYFAFARMLLLQMSSRITSLLILFSC
jgi:hypothetical protein